MSGGVEDSFNSYAAPHSNHYKMLSIEPIDVIEDWGLDFNLGNAVKYIGRANHKGSKRQDLEKAIYYLNRAVSRLGAEV